MGAQSALLHRVRGYALMQRGDQVGARRELEQSLSVARARGADFDVAWAVSALHELCASQGMDPDPAGEAEVASILARLGIVRLPSVAAVSREASSAEPSE